MLLTKRNHAYAESVEAMVGDFYRTCSSEARKDSQLAVTWSMRATRVCHRPIQMLNLFAKQYALKIIVSFNKIPRLDVMSFLFHMVLGRCCTKENPGNVQTSAYECCKRSGAGARDGGYSSHGDRHHAQSVSTFEERCCIGSTTRPFVAGLRNMWRLLG
jgi:hypothetical protein